MSSKISFALAMMFAYGCGGSSAAVIPKMEFNPASLDVVMDGSYTFSVVNTGDAPLILAEAPIITSDGCAGDDESPFYLVFTEGTEFPVTIQPTGTSGLGITELKVIVGMNTPNINCDRVAYLKIKGNDPNRIEDTIKITVYKDEPRIEPNPEIADLGYVPIGDYSEGLLTIQNVGSGDLVISKVIAMTTVSGFSFVWNCNRSAMFEGSEPAVGELQSAALTPIGITGDDGVTIDSVFCSGDFPAVIPENTGFTIPLRFNATKEDPVKAYLTFISNDSRYDAANEQGLKVEVWANQGGRCLRVNPSPIDFGSVVAPGARGMKAELIACGDETVAITGISLSDDSSGDFALILDELGEFGKNDPIEIAPGESRTFTVEYSPQYADMEDNGKIEPDLGSLIVENDSVRTEITTELRGLGVEAMCAVCAFEMKEAASEDIVPDGGNVLPQTFILFDDHSYDPTVGGSISKWKWSVNQPKGSQQVFDPHANYSTPYFEPNVVGEYTFTLEVTNEQGCSATCSQTLRVEPPEGCHIEITWNTPADLDQTNECQAYVDCGADVDLHVVHPYAVGDQALSPLDGSVMGYYDRDYDCFWNNPRPTWNKDNADPLYQPSIDRDDTSGAGPENFTYTFPVDGLCYRVGAHYYDDHNFGASYPTIQVFINSIEPVFKKTLTVPMASRDMWDIGYVCCTAQNVEDAFEEFKWPDGTSVIIGNYEGNLFY